MAASDSDGDFDPGDRFALAPDLIHRNDGYDKVLRIQVVQGGRYRDALRAVATARIERRGRTYHGCGAQNGKGEPE